MRYIFQSSDTGRALPDNMPLTRCPTWRPYTVERIGSDTPSYHMAGRTCARWKPLGNLIRRIRRIAGGLGDFRPLKQDIADGLFFPTFVAVHCRDANLWVAIVCDPDCEERVIYAYGTAIEAKAGNR